MGDEPTYLTGEGSAPSYPCGSLPATPSVDLCDVPSPVDLSQLPLIPDCPMVADYYVGRRLGRGAFGSVYEGWCQDVGMPVAIKSLSKRAMTTRADVARVTREVTLLKLLNHPNCVRLLEVVDSFSHIYLVIEHMAGGELFALVQQRGRLDERSAARVAAQLLSALAYLHALGIAHRDIKAENVLLDATRTRAKLGDFGFAAQRGRRLFTTNCGSPLYAAPELLAGSPYEGPCVDLWAMGVLLHLMVSGRYPFLFEPAARPRDNALALRALYQRIVTGHREAPDVSPACLQLLDALLCPDPARRITAADALHHPWIVQQCGPLLPVLMVPTASSRPGTPLPSSMGSPQVLSRTSSDFGMSDSEGGSTPRDKPFARLARLFRHRPPPVEVNQQCLQCVAQLLGLDEALLSKTIQANHHTHSTALYHLLRLKMERAEVDELAEVITQADSAAHSPADSPREHLEPVLLEPHPAEGSQLSLSFSPSFMILPPEI